MKKSTYNLMKKIPGLSGIADIIIGPRTINRNVLIGTKGGYLESVFVKMHNDVVITDSQIHELFERFNKCNYGVNLGDPMDEAFKEIVNKFFRK